MTVMSSCHQFSSVHSVGSNSLWPHGLQHARPPCPLPTPGAYPNLRSLSRWYHPTISFSVIPFSSAFSLPQHQSLWNESILLIRWPKYWSFSFSISPSNEYAGLTSFRMDWLDLLVLQATLKSSPTPQSKAQLFGTQFSLQSNSHIHMWLLEKPWLWLDRSFLVK